MLILKELLKLRGVGSGVFLVKFKLPSYRPLRHAGEGSTRVGVRSLALTPPVIIMDPVPAFAGMTGEGAPVF